MSEVDYLTQGTKHAVDMVREFEDIVIEQLLDTGEASDDLYNDYDGGDSYHHESHVDVAYSLSEAADLLDQLHEYEETDSGLWDGLQPRRAIEAQAAFTYGNYVMSEWQKLIASINDAWTDEYADYAYSCKEEDREEDSDELYKLALQTIRRVLGEAK